jgi:hypothetical protein
MKSAPLQDVAFTTCSYIKDTVSVRAKMVRKVLASWTELLQLPFAEKIFLDDQSPGRAALKVLDATSLREKFSRVQYHEVKHPPHSNFGIVASMCLASTPYIFHLDDDVFMTTTGEKCREFLELALRLMEDDSSIMGCNILQYDESRHGLQWSPGESYARFPTWAHPRQYYGTAASLIRRELLERVGFEQLMAWGEKQPAHWEKLVGADPKEFLIPRADTPFSSLESAYFYSATSETSITCYLDFRIQRAIYRTKVAVKQKMPAPLLALYRAARGLKGK